MLSPENIGTEAKPVSLANSSANKETTHGGSSQHSVSYIAGEAPSVNSSTRFSCNVPTTLWDDALMSSPRHDAQVFPASSGFTPAFYERNEALSYGGTRIRRSKPLSLRQRGTLSRDDLTFKSRQQSSQVLDGQISCLQVNERGVYHLGANGYSRDPDRSASYSQTQRNRQSSGVSVNTLTAGFERLSVSKLGRRD